MARSIHAAWPVPVPARPRMWEVHGYGEFLEALRDPSHPAHEEMSEWIDKKFDPEKFDQSMTDQILRQLFS